VFARVVLFTILAFAIVFLLICMRGLRKERRRNKH
jgi:hypothetical protein